MRARALATRSPTTLGTTQRTSGGGGTGGGGGGGDGGGGGVVGGARPPPSPPPGPPRRRSRWWWRRARRALWIAAVHTVLVQPGAGAEEMERDGKIVAAGSVGSEISRHFALVRYETNGAPDESFGRHGVAVYQAVASDYGYSVLVQPVDAGQQGCRERIVQTGSSSDYTYGLGYVAAIGVYGSDPQGPACPPPPPPPPGPPPPSPPPPPPPVVRCVVPRVVGLRLAKARVRIRRAHCAVGRISRVRSRRVGRVIRQSPRPGRRIP